MSKDALFAELTGILQEMFEIEPSKISLQSNLYTDLDIDSIDAVDLVVRLKELTGKRLQPEVFKSVRTVQDVVDALANLLAE
ncbi:MAG: acyl carrier protein [Proteobacteria bacterium]|nr:acyl carrier protein [Pseudomonadota bacterium]